MPAHFCLPKLTSVTLVYIYFSGQQFITRCAVVFIRHCADLFRFTCSILCNTLDTFLAKRQMMQIEKQISMICVMPYICFPKKQLGWECFQGFWQILAVTEISKYSNKEYLKLKTGRVIAFLLSFLRM